MIIREYKAMLLRRYADTHAEIVASSPRRHRAIEDDDAYVIITL